MELAGIGADDVRAAAEGDDVALGRVLRALEPDLPASASIQPLQRRVLEADDVLQVSYPEAFLRIGTLGERTPAGFRAWMLRIVETNLIDAIRGLDRDERPDARRRSTHDGSGCSRRTLFERVSGLDPTVSALLSLVEQAERLRATIARLPESDRRVVEEIDPAERLVAEVAVELGRSPGPVHLLVRRARTRLRELMT